ncbi:hypothetical protein ACX0K2_16285 [Pseudomonas extremorientalis]
MKRIFIAALLASAALNCSAAEKLRIIDLSEPDAAQSTPQNQVASPTSSEAKDFITRLDAAVERGNAQILSGKVDPVARRKQAQDLAALQSEGEKFGVLFTPFHKCNEASISAASAWQGLLGSNKRQFDNGIDSYEKERQACLDAVN